MKSNNLLAKRVRFDLTNDEDEIEYEEPETKKQLQELMLSQPDM